MEMKKRTKPITLQILESLNCRIELTNFWKKEHKNQLIGYEAEVVFDSNTRIFLPDCLVANDLRLRNNSSSVQIHGYGAGSAVYGLRTARICCRCHQT